jgi:hypothetical protein
MIDSIPYYQLFLKCWSNLLCQKQFTHLRARIPVGFNNIFHVTFENKFKILLQDYVIEGGPESGLIVTNVNKIFNIR